MQPDQRFFALRRIALIAAALLSCCTSRAADDELLDAVAENLRSPSTSRITQYLDTPPATDFSKATELRLKKLSAFGVDFSGRAKLADGEFNTVSYWSDDSTLYAAVAEVTFKAIASKLEEKHGPAKAADVPNYDDASTNVTHVMRWHVADEVILLYIYNRSPYATLGLVRIKQAAWLRDMGADESEFWQATLRRDAEQSQIETHSSAPNQPIAPPFAPMSSTPDATHSPSASPNASVPDRYEAPSPAVSQTSSTYHMERATITPAEVEEARSIKVQRFQLRGGGSSSAKIIDLEGKTVLDAFPKNTIAACSVSPSGNRILVYSGNSDYEVYDPSTKLRTILPQQPPGDKKLAFSAWHWIDDNSVLGESGDELAPRRDVAGEDTMGIQGRLYLYSTGHRELAELQLPEDLGTKCFSVTEVTPSGYVHLVTADSTTAQSKDLGWFKVPTR